MDKKIDFLQSLIIDLIQNGFSIKRFYIWNSSVITKDVFIDEIEYCKMFFMQNQSLIVDGYAQGAKKIMNANVELIWSLT